MRTSRSGMFAVAVLCATLAACATGGGGAGTTQLSPADLSALEAQRAQHPTDPDVNLRLAKAYYSANRFADARKALALVLTQQPTNRIAQTYLGLSYEGMEQFDSARAIYSALLATKPSGEVGRLLNGRLTLLARKELHASARASLAHETELSRTPPDPNTVAVFPFRYTGQDSSLRPLERGLAALVVSDLSHVRRLRLVERERLQALLDEMRLAASGRVDPTTGARSGHLVGAGQVVQGQFQEAPGTNIRLDATMVRAGDAQVAATGSGRNPLNQLFDLEKSVVFQLLTKTGVPVSPAESIAISERPTKDLQAFLLYSRGLESQDKGDFRAASADFKAAAQRDPTFQAAAQQSQSSDAAQSASGTPDNTLAAIVGGGSVGPSSGPPAGTTQALQLGINTTVPSGATIVDQTGSGTPPSQQRPDPLCEAADCQGPVANPTVIGTIIIIIKRP
ncbi:MAG TPA: tetratricopeptide repeat protein [Gemmatimonadales bacterium]|nr:tetratricopeptide repeat protein [Gemmatimonadales bacterium]